MKKKRGHKILCLLTALCVAVTALINPKESYGAGNSQRYLGTINTDGLSVSSKYSDSGKYDQTFYQEIIDNYDSKYNSEQDSLQIKTSRQLAAFAKAVNEGKDFSGKYVKLQNDINLAGVRPTVKKQNTGSDKFEIVFENPDSNPAGLENVWVPIGRSGTSAAGPYPDHGVNFMRPFKGTFDGGGYKVKGMVIYEHGTRTTNSGNTSASAGFFSCVEDGEIKNLEIDDACVIADGDASTRVGSLIGYQNGGSVTKCCGSGAVYSVRCPDINVGSNAGGLVGYTVHGSLESSYASGTVYTVISGISPNVGGLVGSVGDFSNRNSNPSHIKNSYGSGAVYVSGDGSAVRAGGVAGFLHDTSSITKCYGSGEVIAIATGGGVRAGGLAGTNDGLIEDCYGSAAVSACGSTNDIQAGALVGLVGEYKDEGAGSIKRSYGSGAVSSFVPSGYAEAYAGGLIGGTGRGGASLENNYRNSEAEITAKKVKDGTLKDGNIITEGTPLTRQEMTGTGTGRADKKMTGLSTGVWDFEKDGSVKQSGTHYYQNLYFPRIKSISYTEENKPKYQKNIYRLDQCIQVQIKGEVSEGTVLSAVVTQKAGSPAKVSNPAYQWYVGGSPVSGAVKSTYSVAKKDVGKAVKVVVTHGGFYGSVTATAKQPGTAASSARPAKPKVKTSVTYKTVKVSWKKVKGAKGYQVYRASKKNGKYKKVKTTGSGSWTNKKLTPGKSYYYKVRAYRKAGKKTIYGSFSAKVKAVPRTKAPMFTLKAGRRTIKVTWKKTEGSHGYQIWRSWSKGGNYRVIKDSRTNRRYISLRLMRKHKYYYKMRSYRIVKGKRVYSAYTKVKTVRTK